MLARKSAASVSVASPKSRDKSFISCGSPFFEVALAGLGRGTSASLLPKFFESTFRHKARADVQAGRELGGLPFHPDG